MPEYLAPGVYVEEVDRGAKSIEGVSTSTAGFLGPTERGPTDPRLVTSYANYRRLYGGGLEGTHLPTAVEGFFANGGGRCFVGRITPTATVAEGALTTEDGQPTTTSDDDDDDNGSSTTSETDGLTAKAIGPGKWGSRVAIMVENASMHRTNDQLFKLIIRYWADDDAFEKAVEGDADPSDDHVPAPNVEEVYDDLSTEKSSSNYYTKQVNGASALVELDPGTTSRPENTNGDPVWLAGSFDTSPSLTVNHYTGEEPVGLDGKSGFEAFERIDDISIVCVPDEHDVPTVTDELIQHCHAMGDRFAILQSEQNPGPTNDIEPPDDTDMGAFYYPWLEIRNSETGLTESIPPGGHVAGIYARSDGQHGVHKAPANEVVRDIQGLDETITKGDQEILNPRGVNCIRSFRGRGIRVWGARTPSSDPQWKYINVRRLFLFLEESIDEGTQWVVFEPNDEQLWARVRQTISNFLINVWENGALMGTTPEEAFYVKCDRSTMTQNDIDNGRLICEIGVAPVKPAEFVVFRISQWTGSAE